MQHRLLAALILGAGAAAFSVAVRAAAPPPAAGGTSYKFNDSHLHLTNYVQKGTDIRQMIAVMGSAVGRAAIFGIPLQQEWSHRVSGNVAPTYYLDTDAPLYYYSFTDAHIAMAYRSLSKEQQDRLDPMITGFNPADMYAVDHVRRVLETFPGVFSGIGEFTVHKEFVSSKIAGTVASLTDPALDRLLAFAAEVGLVVILHNDVDMPFAKKGTDPVYLAQLKALFRRHPRTTIIWAHVGVGRVVHPVDAHAAMVRGILGEAALAHVHFDLSWSEAAKYLVATAESTQLAADILTRYPDRFLFGTDEVAPTDATTYLRVYEQYRPLWDKLDQRTRDKLLKLNYARLFDNARRRVRAWEQSHVRDVHTGGGPEPRPR